MKHLSLLSILFFLLLSVPAMGQNELPSLQTISGKVTVLDVPIADVNITIEGSRRGTKTDSNGEYVIQARPGDAVKFSYVGLRPTTIIIEDVTETLNVTMTEKRNTLEAAVVKARKKTSSNSISNIKEEEVFNTELNLNGKLLNPLKSGWATGHIPGKLVNNGLPLLLTLNGKVSGVTSDGNNVRIRGGIASFIVDGQPTNKDALPSGEFVHDIFVLKRAGIIYIRTIFNPSLVAAKKEAQAEKYRNQDYYEEDAISYASEITGTTQNNKARPQVKGPIKDITGKISYLESPLENVNITIEGSQRGTQTNKRGKYRIEARQGEVLIYSHVGFRSVVLIVEDITKELSFEMIPIENELEEVLVTARNRNGKVVEFTKKAQSSFQTSRGKVDPRAAGYSVGYVDGEAINPASRDLFEVLSGKVAGVQVNPVTKEIRVRGGTGSILNDIPPIWEVDGVILSLVPELDVTDIKDIRVLKSLASLTKYGTQGAGGVIVIQTKSGDYSASTKATNKGFKEQYANNNFYSNDATQADDGLLASAAVQELRSQLLTESNPEIIKSLAYQFQAMGMKRETVEAYEKVFTLRPKYAQSYRDLANAYVENEQFKRAWRMYMSYLGQGFKGNEEGIGELVFDEMEWLFFRRKNQTDIRQSFQTKSEDIDEFKNDVRFVFEWNTSEAEFDLEFVSPDKRAYVFEHSIASNQKLINEEKRKGYSSKRFFINDVGDGEWLVNLTYNGNKKEAPTYFKLTIYYNWGEYNEKKEVRVYKLAYDQRQKLQLLKVNKQVMLAYE